MLRISLTVWSSILVFPSGTTSGVSSCEGWVWVVEELSLFIVVLPFVPKNTFINSSWFCGGVPNNENDRGGDVRVVNPGDAPLQGHLTVFSDAPDAKVAERSFEVPGRGVWTAVLNEVQPTGTYLSALVEIAGGGGFVEQRAVAKSGTAVSPCSNSTSTNWYFADNYTLNDSREDLVITNPFPDDAILYFTFASNNGTRKPQNLQGFPVKGNSVAVVSQDNMPKDEAVLAISVEATRGRVVVARAQRYLGERSGFSLSLGAPSLSSDWWFADGEKSDAVTFERYSIYNPGNEDVSVTATVLGIDIEASPDFVPTRTDIVPAGQVLSYTTKEFEGMPAGRHVMSFSTESADDSALRRLSSSSCSAITVSWLSLLSASQSCHSPESPSSRIGALSDASPPSRRFMSTTSCSVTPRRFAIVCT